MKWVFWTTNIGVAACTGTGGVGPFLREQNCFDLLQVAVEDQVFGIVIVRHVHLACKERFKHIELISDSSTVGGQH